MLEMMNGSSQRSDVLRETRRDNLISPPFEPLFFGDWAHALFIHYEVDAAVLQNEVPFELDLWNGKAFVSLVAFSLRRLRPCSGGRLGELLFKPIASTRFLNVRTYVRHRNESGIYFIAEFLSNPLCVPLGPPTFGLPYRFGRLVYRHSLEDGIIGGTAQVAGGSKLFSWQAALAPYAEFQPCKGETLDAFLLERYTAFTCCRNKRRCFRIWHSPWPQRPAEVAVRNEGLLATTGDWINRARFSGANYSPGVSDVWMGRPERIHYPERKRRLRVFFDV